MTLVPWTQGLHFQRLATKNDIAQSHVFLADGFLSLNQLVERGRGLIKNRTRSFESNW